MKKHIIAGTSQQAQEWLRTNFQERIATGDKSVSLNDYSIVFDAQMLRGLQDVHGVFIGTWRDRKDIVEILDVLALSVPTNPTILRLRRELHKVRPTPKQPPLQKVAGGYALAVKDAANLLAKEIDAQVLKELGIKQIDTYTS